MICPRWVLTRTQPISIDDVLRYLTEALTEPASVGRIIDIGGPEALAYRDMMLQVARVLRLRRWLIEVPVLTRDCHPIGSAWSRRYRWPGARAD